MRGRGLVASEPEEEGEKGESLPHAIRENKLRNVID